ncbi:hypothetical protein [Streptomyces sp. MNP-20]|uniref:hypothetical protein n=1 Tax=Streptomyces sp. MNP-20 TaxID=2721165 RepID=UPI0015516859|nr:hypothetical protein [Streptomyces sp. MNP-20]
MLGEVLEAAKGAVGFDGESVTPLPTSGRKLNQVHRQCGQAVLEKLEKAGGLEKLSEDHELVSAHHATTTCRCCGGTSRATARCCWI